MFPKRIQETATYKRTKAFVVRYDRFLMPSMLLGGTVIDAAQFRLLDIQTTFLISGIYAALCALSMIAMVATIPAERRLLRYVQLAAPLVQQFTIGALLSTSLLFYWFSGAVGASWPVLGVIALLMVFNEVLRDYFTRPSVQIGVFSFALLTQSATFAAYALNSLHPVVFVIGNLAGLLAVILFLIVFLRAGKLEHKRNQSWFTAAGVFAFMNIFYFLNVIPPIPLSLREAGVYYSVSRVDSQYELIGVDESWFERLIPGQSFAVAEGDRLYAFTSIYAPVALSTRIVHRWQYADEATGEWVTTTEPSFGIIGGRDEGYRGYSYATMSAEGEWRVIVETPRGQELGTLSLSVEFVEE